MNPEFDKNDPLWKALDAFGQVEPHPQSRARIWARIANAGSSAPSRMRWVMRAFLPAAGLACLILTAVVGWRIHQRNEEDREIAANMELYENLDVIQNMPQLASYDEPSDEDFDEIVE